MKDTWFSQCLGNEMDSICFHHQAIKEVGKDIIVCGFDE